MKRRVGAKESVVVIFHILYSYGAIPEAFGTVDMIRYVVDTRAKHCSEVLQSLKGKGQEVAFCKRNFKCNVEEHHFVCFLMK